ncbi:MAG: hypothetical protein HC828_22045 [Blastochloris sp.]|nr:hypothetical protein [Blastochloris sp.]
MAAFAAAAQYVGNCDSCSDLETRLWVQTALNEPLVRYASYNNADEYLLSSERTNAPDQPYQDEQGFRTYRLRHPSDCATVQLIRGLDGQFGTLPSRIRVYPCGGGAYTEYSLPQDQALFEQGEICFNALSVGPVSPVIVEPYTFSIRTFGCGDDSWCYRFTFDTSLEGWTLPTNLGYATGTLSNGRIVGQFGPPAAYTRVTLDRTSSLPAGQRSPALKPIVCSAPLIQLAGEKSLLARKEPVLMLAQAIIRWFAKANSQGISAFGSTRTLREIQPQMFWKYAFTEQAQTRSAARTVKLRYEWHRP